MLHVERVTKTYGDRTVLDGVSFEVPRGQILGFVGANGAGKTTTMRIVMGVLDATSGEVRWDERPADRAVRRTFGYMPEERGLYQRMTVVEQVRWFGEIYGMTPTDARHEADGLIEALDLTAHRDHVVQALSLGNQQRAQLAVALVHRPVLLVLDEPFSGLDPIGVDALSALLRARSADGVSVVFSSHQLDLVERVVDRVAVIRDGRVVVSGPAEQVRARGGDRVRLRIAGARPDWQERVPARVVGHDGADVLVEPDGDPQALLHALLREGRVDHFGHERTPLSEVVRGLVA